MNDAYDAYDDVMYPKIVAAARVWKKAFLEHHLEKNNMIIDSNLDVKLHNATASLLGLLDKYEKEQGL